MKNFKILFSIAVASALVGCSSMAIDDEEILEGNLPADFDVNEYMELHPELKRIQIKDFIAIHNENAEKAAKNAGTAAEFKTAKAADEAAVLKAESGRRSDEKTGGILADAEKIRSELREQAEAKLDEAAELIVERIVNG